MKRLIRALVSALMGATIGYVVHQLAAPAAGADPEKGELSLVVGAPAVNAAIGTAVGLVAGRRAAFWSAFAVSAAAGTSLDGKVRELECVQARLGEGTAEPAGEEA